MEKDCESQKKSEIAVFGHFWVILAVSLTSQTYEFDDAHKGPYGAE